MEQTGPIAPTDRVEVQTKRREGWCDRRLPRHRVAITPEVLRDLSSIARVWGNGFEERGNVMEPGGAWVEGLAGLGTRRYRCLPTVIQVGEPRGIALDQPAE